VTTASDDISLWRDELNKSDVIIPYTLIACENADGELLMLKRTKPPFVGMWNFVGGKIEPDESPEVSAHRELLEELGHLVAPRALKYRGVAFWPENVGDDTCYKGMHLFYAKLSAKAHLTGQLALLDEGILAWLPKQLLAEGDGFHAVPNFGVLCPVMFDGEDPRPKVLFHWPDTSAGYHDFVVPLRASYGDPTNFPRGKGRVPIRALAEFADAA
jgi:8-oxo-dGTP diphosphatase